MINPLVHGCGKHLPLHFLLQLRRQINRVGDTVEKEEKTVKSFLNSNFTFDTDLNHNMKASTLFDLILGSKECKIEEKNASPQPFLPCL